MLQNSQDNTTTMVLRPTPWRAAAMLSWREMIRFLRQRNRVIGAVGQPILFWLLFGTGMNRTFDVPGQNFSEYFVPGTLVLILLFTAIFATISIIEDRKEGFLQSWRVPHEALEQCAAFHTRVKQVEETYVDHRHVD